MRPQQRQRQGKEQKKMKKNETMDGIKNSLRSTTAFLKRHGCTPCKGHYGNGYHYHSGFFTSPKGLLWYWATGDDRWNDTILFRRAKSLRDYVGDTNQYPKDGEEFDRMIEWHEENDKEIRTDVAAGKKVV